MSAEVAHDGRDEQYIAVDASELEAGDEVIITDDAEKKLRGTVESTKTEAGRYGVNVVDEDGTEWMCWEQTGRGFTKVEAKPDLGELLSSENGLDMENNVEYLLGLVGEALRDAENFENDAERAEWVVAQWCQELQYVPDLSGYTTGQCVPLGEIPPDIEEVLFKESQAKKGVAN